MPRQARLDSPGTLHHVIIRGIEKNKVVDDQYDRKNLLKRIGGVAEETGTLIYNYGLTLAETGRQLGVTTSAVSKNYTRNKKRRKST